MTRARLIPLLLRLQPRLLLWNPRRVRVMVVEKISWRQVLRPPQAPSVHGGLALQTGGESPNETWVWGQTSGAGPGRARQSPQKPVLQEWQSPNVSLASLRSHYCFEPLRALGQFQVGRGKSHKVD